MLRGRQIQRPGGQKTLEEVEDGVVGLPSSDLLHSYFSRVLSSLLY